MRIKSHTAVLVGVITASGILLGSGIVAGYQRIEEKSYQMGPNAGAIKDMKRLETSMGQWVLTTDLVLNGGETYMHRSAERQSRELLVLVDELRESSLAADNLDDLAAIEKAVEQIRQIVTDGAELAGEDREDQLNELVRKADSISTPLVRTVESLEGALLTKSKYLQDDLRYQRWLLDILAWCAGLGYLLVVGVTAFWTVRSTVLPLERLSHAAKSADVDDTEFTLQAGGPEEVRQLTHNITSFVTDLQQAKEIVEEEVRLRTAQLIKANQAKSEFLAKMSHELRTPLNGVINMNQLILHTNLSPEQREYARVAKTAGDALLDLINDILDFSKMEAGMLVLEETKFDLREVVGSVSEILSNAALAGDLQLGSIVQHEVPEKLIGDPLRLRQVLMNLTNNALKFTASGSVVTRVSIVEQRGGKEVLMFRVTDSGIGIAKDRIPALFEAFTQADSSTTREYGGTGLGLSICKQLVELMGGELGVESELHVGSTFWFTVSVEACPMIEESGQELVQRDQRAIVLSRRDILRQQLYEQLRCIGFGEDQVYVQSGTTLDQHEVLEFLSPDPARTFVICDDLGQEAAIRELQDELLGGDGEASPRLCTIQHLLVGKHKPDSALAGVDTLLEPVQFKNLKTWIARKPSAPHIEKAEDSSLESNFSGRVLIAEDNPINQRVAITILEHAGLECFAVDNGQEAVEFLRTNPCDLVLMDCEMPVMDGWKSTKSIRALESEAGLADGCPPQIPIIAVTANALGIDRERCFEVGMNGYVAKPVEARLLLEAISKFLPTAAATLRTPGVGT